MGFVSDQAAFDAAGVVAELDPVGVLAEPDVEACVVLVELEAGDEAAAVVALAL